MSLLRYEPHTLLNEIDRLLGKKIRLTSDEDTSNVETSHWIPAIDIKEDSEKFSILADLPGIDKKDICISMENNVLTIKGDRIDEAKEEKENYKRIERVRGSFYRRFTLPDTADGDKIEASMKKGVLEITIPKREVAKSKLINIIAND